jgi:cell division protein ZapA
MSQDNHVVSIKLLDREYKIKCPAEDVKDLENSAQYVNEQMKKVQKLGSLTSIDRIAVVAALNICHELINLQKQNQQIIHSIEQRSRELQNRIKNVITHQEEIAV